MYNNRSRNRAPWPHQTPYWMAKGGMSVFSLWFMCLDVEGACGKWVIVIYFRSVGFITYWIKHTGSDHELDLGSAKSIFTPHNSMGNYEQMGEISHLRLSLTVIVERESYCCTTDVTRHDREMDAYPPLLFYLWNTSNVQRNFPLRMC